MTGRHFPGTILWAWNIRSPGSTIIEASPGIISDGSDPCSKHACAHVRSGGECTSKGDSKFSGCPFLGHAPVRGGTTRGKSIHQGGTIQRSSLVTFHRKTEWAQVVFEPVRHSSGSMSSSGLRWGFSQHSSRLPRSCAPVQRLCNVCHQYGGMGYLPNQLQLCEWGWHFCPHAVTGHRLGENIFCLEAARVRVPGRSPFSQLILRETDKSNVVRKTKTFIFKGQTNERINQTNSTQISLRGRVNQRREDHSRVKSSTVH